MNTIDFSKKRLFEDFKRVDLVVSMLTFHSGPDFIEIDINFKKKFLGNPARYPIQGYSKI